MLCWEGLNMTARNLMPYKFEKTASSIYIKSLFTSQELQRKFMRHIKECFSLLHREVELSLNLASESTSCFSAKEVAPDSFSWSERTYFYQSDLWWFSGCPECTCLSQRAIFDSFRLFDASRCAACKHWPVSAVYATRHSSCNLSQPCAFASFAASWCNGPYRCRSPSFDSLFIWRSCLSFMLSGPHDQSIWTSIWPRRSPQC